MLTLNSEEFNNMVWQQLQTLIDSEKLYYIISPVKYYTSHTKMLLLLPNRFG